MSKDDEIEVDKVGKDVVDETSNKLDLMIINNGWNDKNEILIVSIGENAASYKWMHEKSNKKYSFYNTLTGLIIVILNTTLLTQVITTSTDPVILILQKVIVFVVTIMSIINNFLKFEERSTNHLNATKNFNELYHGIQQQMCMYRKDRSIASNYIKKILNVYDHLIIASPDVPESILNEFKKKFKNSDIQMPDIADKIQKIDIVTQEPTNPDTIINMDKPTLEYTKDILKIDGDIRADDIPSLKKLLKKRELSAQADYEYNRLRLLQQHDD